MTRLYYPDPTSKVWLPNSAVQPPTSGGGGGGTAGVLWGINVGNLTGAPHSSPTQRLAEYGRVPAARIYYSGVLPNAIGTKEKKNAPEKRWQVSFKASAADLKNGVLDNTIVSYANSVAAYSPSAQAYITFHHEPNGDFNGTDFTLADYKAGYIRMSTLLWSLTTKNQVMPMLNYSAPKGGLTNPGGASWDDSWMIPFSDFANPNATISWDSYGNPSGVNCTALGCPYTTPSYTFDNVFEKSQLGGWDFDGGWGITETGAPLRAFDADHSGRIAWFNAAISYLTSHSTRPHHVFLWEGNGNNWDQNISTAAERAPWKAAFATSV